MKKLNLACDRGHGFAGWFRSDDELKETLAANALACPDCGSTRIAKSLQTPSIPAGLGKNRGADSAPLAPVKAPEAPQVPTVAAPPKVPAPPMPLPPKEVVEQFAKLYTAMKTVQAHVEKNFENVGTGFAKEARKIHDGEREETGIYGSARREEIEELLDDGIEVMPLPTLPKPDA